MKDLTGFQHCLYYFFLREKVYKIQLQGIRFAFESLNQYTVPAYQAKSLSLKIIKKGGDGREENKTGFLKKFLRKSTGS